MPAPPPFIWAGSHEPALSAYPLQCCFLRQSPDEPPGLLWSLQYTWHFNPQGLSHCRLPGQCVRSYRTISPLPVCTGGIISVTLSVSGQLPTRPPPVRWCGALRCPDFPPLRGAAAAERSHSPCKDRIFGRYLSQGCRFRAQPGGSGICYCLYLVPYQLLTRVCPGGRIVLFNYSLKRAYEKREGSLCSDIGCGIVGQPARAGFRYGRVSAVGIVA